MNKIIVVLSLSLLTLSAPALAQLPPPDANNPAVELKGDLVYRVNLGRAEDVKLLLNRGAKADDVDKNGVPLLFLAAERKDPEGANVMQVLIDAGANINLTDKEGQNALFYAAKVGSKPSVDFLLHHNVNSYATNRRGETARVVAHKNGHDDIVSLMDSFTKEQQEAVHKQYEDANKAMEERYKKEQADLAAQEEALKKQADDVAKANAEEQKKLDAEKAAVAKGRAINDKTKDDLAKEDLDKQAAAEKPADDKAAAADKIAPVPVADPEPEPAPKPVDTTKITNPLLHELSYHSCAFEYWSYCKSSPQPTELSKDELKLAIDSHRERALTISQQMVNDYKMQTTYLEGIEDVAKKRIFAEIDSMPSKIERHEQGVGKMDDLENRCGDIADSWDDEGAQTLATPKGPSGGGKGGKRGGGKNNGTPTPKAAPATPQQGSGDSTATPAAKPAAAAAKPAGAAVKQPQHGQWDIAPKWPGQTQPQQQNITPQQ